MDRKFWIGLAVNAVLVLAVIALSVSLTDMKRRNDISSHNYEAAKSELTSERMKNGSLLYEKEALILNEKNMMEELEFTKEEMRELNRKLSAQAAYISKLEGEIRIDTVKMVNDSIVYVDNTPQYVYFRNNDPWLTLRGKSDLGKRETTLYGIRIPVPMTLGITKDHSIFVKTENPYLSITDVNAVALEDYVAKATKRRHWGFGLYGGFGVHYDVMTKTGGFGPQLGVGVLYRF